VGRAAAPAADGSTDGERRLDATGKAIGLDSLGGCDEDEIYQFPDSRVLLATGERVGVQLLGEVLGYGVDWEFDRSDPSEVEEIRPAENIWRIDDRVSAREVEVERHELQPGNAGNDSDT
jgi:hypothetical protein